MSHTIEPDYEQGFMFPPYMEDWLRPDHNTLWAFFQENKRALREVFKHSVRVALHADLIGLVLHAVDGTKMQAAVGNASGRHRTALTKREALLDQAVRDLEAKLEESREAEGSAGLGTDPWALAYA